jgi:trehalose 6-phosphate phosphatase
MSRLFVAQSHRRGSGLATWRRAPREPGRRGSRHLFDRWAEVESRLVSAPHLALFLDFDGTLAPIRQKPDDVRLDPAVRKVLARLARHPRVTVCIISGRRLKDLRPRAAVPGARYIGLHGWEREGSAKSGPIPGPLALAKQSILRMLGSAPGIRVEDKGMSCAVHYRGAPERTVRNARAAFREALEPLGGQVRVLRGKKVWEVLPSDSPGKGAAAAKFLAQLKPPALPVYVGDDTTDESAFATLRGGVTVRVGPMRHTRARFRLRDPREVWDFLRRLAEEVL